MSDEVVQGSQPEQVVIDLIPDELALARSQIDAGLAPLAEGTLIRRIAWLETEGPAAADELDAARLLVAEALWRQQRPLAARSALDGIRAGSPHRQRPIALLVEAEALAASGEPDRAAGVMERAIAAIGLDEAWRLRAGTPSRLPWPLPAELRPEPRQAHRPPWGGDVSAVGAGEAGSPPGPDTAAAHARVEAARAAYAAADVTAADTDLAVALRLDPTVASEAIGLLEPTLGDDPPAGRLVLYGDLLRAAGREAGARAAYTRAAASRG
jgi:hypothetical protein